MAGLTTGNRKWWILATTAARCPWCSRRDRGQRGAAHHPAGPAHVADSVRLSATEHEVTAKHRSASSGRCPETRCRIKRTPAHGGRAGRALQIRVASGALGTWPAVMAD
jgi:hypothetical protein